MLVPATLLKLCKNINVCSKDGKRLVINRFRFATVCQPKPIPNQGDVRYATDEDIREFESYFPFIVREIIDRQLITSVPDINQRIERNLNYNVPYGKHLRPRLLISTYKYIQKPEIMTPENLKLMNILAWCAEIMNSVYLMLDDIMDNSETRRGQKAWFKHEDIGMNAINDCCLLESAFVSLLEAYFDNHKNFMKLLKVFTDAKKNIFVGLMLDSETNSYDKFTYERYKLTAEHKTGYCFTFPLYLAIAFSDRSELKISQAETVLKLLAHIYQIQNDFTDCYGEKFAKKIGNDIEEKKCSWLILMAREQASQSQKKILDECYGFKDVEKVNAVKRVYQELDIEGQYEHVEKDKYQEICKELGRIPDHYTKTFFTKLVAVFFGEEAVISR